jgi:uncharacterized protein YbaA (DUF1428 family)
MKLEKEKRMLAILQGEVPLEEITDKEILFLQKRVFTAIQQKMMADPKKFNFQEHRTLQ